jgi:hypothetical protein
MKQYVIIWNEPSERYTETKFFESVEALSAYIKSELAEYGHLGVSVLKIKEVILVDIDLSEIV